MKALLALEDGFVLEGRSFTGPCEGGGEVIFNTGMTGYQEILTDPSYYGQMVCMTWPLIGNYGINAEDMESGRVHAAALIVKECCKTPSNWRSVCSLPDFLQQHGVPGIEGIDTRALTRHLRMHGAMRGMVSTSITDPAELVMQAKSLPSMEGQNLVTRVMPATPWKWTGNGGVPAELNADGSYNWPGEGPRLVAYDFGIKWNILRLLTAQGFDVLVVPPSFTAEQVKASGAQAVFLSNGPGDPATLTDEIVTIKKLVDPRPNPPPAHARSHARHGFHLHHRSRRARHAGEVPAFNGRPEPRHPRNARYAVEVDGQRRRPRRTQRRRLLQLAGRRPAPRGL